MNDGHDRREPAPAGGTGAAGGAIAQRAPGRRTLVPSAAGAPAGAARPTIDDVATQTIDQKDAGEAVAPEVRGRVEPALGVDLGAVRVHSDQVAQDGASLMGARAFANQGDVFLGPGESGRDL